MLAPMFAHLHGDKLFAQTPSQAVRTVANNNLIWKIAQRYGSFFGARKGLWEQLATVDRDYLLDTDTEFLESSWCNRNANWVTFLFVGYAIHRPEKEYYTVKDWKQDISDLISSPSQDNKHPLFLVTVPRITRAPEAPSFFFYNTHWFVVQVIPPRAPETLSRFKIYSGFARHYRYGHSSSTVVTLLLKLLIDRVIDYLQEWEINSDIPDHHRLKMNRTLYAGEDIEYSVFLDTFLTKLEVFIDEVCAHLE